MLDFGGPVMSWWKALVIAVILAVPAAGFACPNCKEAVTAASDEAGDDDPFREARAYNHSIYFMLAVPYLLVGSLGVAGYRMYRKAGRCGPGPS